MFRNLICQPGLPEQRKQQIICSLPPHGVHGNLSLQVRPLINSGGVPLSMAPTRESQPIHLTGIGRKECTCIAAKWPSWLERAAAAVNLNSRNTHPVQEEMRPHLQPRSFHAANQSTSALCWMQFSFLSPRFLVRRRGRL